MGAISRLAGSGQESWTSRLQGPTNKEEPRGRPIRPRPSSLSASNDRLLKLLSAMESPSPGSWSDDRYEQTMRHFVGITYVAIHRVCVQLSQAKAKVYRHDPNHPEGKVPIRRGEEAYELVELLARPNEQDSFGKLMYRWGQQRRLTGTALTWAPLNMLGKPYKLFSVPTATAIPQPAVNEIYPDGYYRIQPIYPYGPFTSAPGVNSSVGAPVDARTMMRMFYPHPFLRYEGYSPLTGMRLHIDAIEMIDKARHYMMRRGIFPNAVLNSTDADGASEINDDQIERIRALFEEEHQGPENFGRLFMAYAGWKLEKWGDPPSEMAFEGGWDQLSSFILGGGFGITKPAAGMVEDSSYQTLFATMKQLHVVTLDPECQEISEELTRYLGSYWGDDIIVEVEVPRIDDHEITFSQLGIAIQGKCMTKNELRKKLDMPVTHELWGADFAGTDSMSPSQMLMGGMQQGLMMPGQPMPTDPLGQTPGGMVEMSNGGMDPMMAAMMNGGQDPNQMGGTPPSPGRLSQGSLGPRPGTLPGKRLKGMLTAGDRFLGANPQRSVYDIFREMMGEAKNGNGRH